MKLVQFYKTSRAFRYACLGVWAAIIFAFSAQQQLPSPNEFALNFIFKKIAHITVYFILYLLAYHAISFDEKRTKRASLLSFVTCLLYALSDEFHQSFIPGRTSNIRDVFYDAIGMFISWLVIFKYI